VYSWPRDRGDSGSGKADTGPELFCFINRHALFHALFPFPLALLYFHHKLQGKAALGDGAFFHPHPPPPWTRCEPVRGKARNLQKQDLGRSRPEWFQQSLSIWAFRSGRAKVGAGWGTGSRTWSRARKGTFSAT
jgi:hypothetical protein